MPRKLVVSLSHLCSELFFEKISTTALVDCLFFLDESRARIVDYPRDYVLRICSQIEPPIKEKIFTGIIVPAILLAEHENRCRWTENLVFNKSRHTNWQEQLEKFLLEHGYPQLFTDKRVTSVLPFCSTGLTAVSHAIDVLGLDLEFV